MTWPTASDRMWSHETREINIVTNCVGGRHNMSPPLWPWPIDVESGVRVTCDVGYLCANFGLPRPLCSRHRPNIRDRQTSDAHHRLMPPPYGGGCIITTGHKRRRSYEWRLTDDMRHHRMTQCECVLTWSLQHDIQHNHTACRAVHITDSALVDLGIRSSCAIGNNELVVTRN